MADPPHKIFLIDDSQDYLELYGKFVTGLGHKAVKAKDCAEARKVFQPGVFSCALVDLTLPDGKGTDLISEFSKRDPFLVSVVVTGDASAESVIGTMREGAFDYLTKPCPGAVLKHAISRALEHHEAIRQRASLTQLLLEEREQLKLKVEQATKDLVAHVAMCEANNAQLSALLRLTLISTTGLETEEDLMTTVFSEIGQFTKIVCLAIQDGQQGDFMSVCKDASGETTFVNVGGQGTRNRSASDRDKPAWEDSMREALVHLACVEPDGYKAVMFPRRSMGTVCMLFDEQAPPPPSLDEFLEMCAHHLATEWQMSRLLQYTARYASMGRIAIDLAKTIMRGLSAIQLTGDVLQEMVESGEAKNLLEIIPQNVAELRDQIREFQRIAQSRKDTLETVRLDTLIDQALVILSGTAASYGVEIVKEFQGECECTLLNGTALQRTFLEILSVALRRLSQGGRIILRIEDEGSSLVKFDMILEPGGGKSAAQDAFSMVSLADELERRPGFLLYQRTIHACAGRILRETDAEGREALTIVLPRNAAKRHPME